MPAKPAVNEFWKHRKSIGKRTKAQDLPELGLVTAATQANIFKCSVAKLHEYTNLADDPLTYYTFPSTDGRTPQIKYFHPPTSAEWVMRHKSTAAPVRRQKGVRTPFSVKRHQRRRAG